jgi:hypothetical protein
MSMAGINRRMIHQIQSRRDGIVIEISDMILRQLRRSDI